MNANRDGRARVAARCDRHKEVVAPGYLTLVWHRYAADGDPVPHQAVMFGDCSTRLAFGRSRWLAVIDPSRLDSPSVATKERDN